MRKACLTMPDPEPDEMFAFAYREPHPLVEEERAWFAGYHAGFADAGAETSRGCAMSTQTTIAKAINAGLRAAMEKDPKVLVMGEDVGKLGGVFRVTDGLQKDFGEDRVIDTPLAESGIIGTAIGLALRGYRPVCEIQFDGFIYPAYDQIVSQLAKMGNRSRGQVKLPVVVRVPFGGGIGAVEHHSESPEAYFAHTAGLRIVSLRQPRGRLLDDPAGGRQRRPGDVLRAQAPLLGEGRARRLRRPARWGCTTPGWSRPGEHVTVAAYGPMVQDRPGRRHRRRGRRHEHRGRRPALAVAARPRHPRRLGREDPPAGRRARGARVPGPRRRDRGPGHRAVLLRARGARAAGRRVPHAVPASRLEEEYLPDLDRVLDAVDRVLAY